MEDNLYKIQSDLANGIENFFYKLLLTIIIFIILSVIVDCFYKPKGISIKEYIIGLDGFGFERFCKDLFITMGYKAKMTPKSNDGGKDIILYDKNRIYVECKHFKGHSVGRPIAQKLYGAMASDNVKHGIIITTAYFSKECLEYCRKMGIKCIDMNQIVNLCKKYNFKP